MTSLGRRCRQPAVGLALPTLQLTSSLERRRAPGGLLSEASMLRESPEREPHPRHTRQAFLCCGDGMVWSRGSPSTHTLDPR